MKFLILIVVAVSVFWGQVPVVAAAQDLASLAGCSGTDCSACNVVDLANGIIQWLIGFLFLIFAVVAVWAGFGLVTSGGNRGALDAAKEKLVNAVVGIVIVLAAWLIVDTVMRGLVGPTGHEGSLKTEGVVSGWLFWSEVQCQTQIETDAFKAWQEHIITALDGVGTWAPDSAGIPAALCDTTGGYSGIPITYNCANQIAQCTLNGGGSPTISSDGSSVICVPDADVITSVGGTGANCPAAPDSEMVTIPGTTFRATPATANNFVAMRAAAAADGITLRVTSGHRSEATQVEIWNRHGCNARSCSGTVARPCSLGGNGSNHNRGVALDISVGSAGSPTFNWLKANGGRYGFYNNLDARDPVHWSPSGR